MSERQRDFLILFGLGLLINGLVAIAVDTPGYVDAYYYFNGGLHIARDGALTDPYLWSYVTPNLTLPAPAFAYWQPLPSFLAAVGMWVFGMRSPFGSAQAIFVLLSACLPILTYTIAEHIAPKRRHALVAGLLTVFSGFYVSYWSLTESFTPYALVGAGALLLAGLARSRERWWLWLAAGVCAGLGHLTRADGLALLGVAGLIALFPMKTSRYEVSSSPRIRLIPPTLVTIGYLLVMGPWFMRNIATFGSPQPPGGLQAIWLLEYNDLFMISEPLSASRYFAAGWPTILAGKWDAVKGNFGSFVAVQNLIFLTPFTIIAAWKRWRDDLVLPALIYQFVLFVAMTFIFPFPGMRGGYFHSAGALLPIGMVMAILGLEDVLRWVSRRFSSWRFEPSFRFFSSAMVGGAIILTVYLAGGRVIGFGDLSTISWNHADNVYFQIAETLDDLAVPPDAPIMSNNTPGFYTFTGHGGIPLPDGDESDLLQLADAHGVTYLVIDHNTVAALRPIYEGDAESGRLILIKTYGDENPVYLYQITSPGS